MKRTTLIVIALVAILAVALAVYAGKGDKPAEKSVTTAMAKVGEPAPDFTLTDVAGNKHKLADYHGKYVVLEWINFACPFVKKHYGSGNMQSLQADYRDKNVVWLTICSSAPGKQGYYEGEALTTAVNAHGLQTNSYLIDSDGSVGRMYNAKTTPNMYVIDPKGRLIYAGAIDDKPTANPDDIPGSTNYVQAALDASMNGKEVAVKATQPYGCSVKY